MPKGKLIVLDGPDGSGKTKQAELLLTRMHDTGRPTAAFSFPTYGTKSAGPVEEYLAGLYGTPEEVGPKRASILYAVNRWAEAPTMRATLDSGMHAISNRWVAANMGHQGSKIADSVARMEYFKWNEELEYGHFGIPRPDINIILHVPPEISMLLIEKRGNAKDAHENIDHLRAAERTYLEIVASFPGFALIECTDGKGKTLDNLLPMPVIHEMVWAEVSKLF